MWKAYANAVERTMLQADIVHDWFHISQHLNEALDKVAEGLNSKIQIIKSNARGYRSFEGFRNSILFYCGDLV
jgi:transposase